MGAPNGNKFAEKWTDEKALELAEKALEIVNDDCYYISHVAEKCDTYREFFSYILNAKNNNEKVFNTIKKMQNKCERIIAQKTASGEIVPSLGIFILKSYHNLTETSRFEHDLRGEIKNQIYKLPDGTEIEF